MGVSAVKEELVTFAAGQLAQEAVIGPPLDDGGSFAAGRLFTEGLGHGLEAIAGDDLTSDPFVRRLVAQRLSRPDDGLLLEVHLVGRVYTLNAHRQHTIRRIGGRVHV